MTLHTTSNEEIGRELKPSMGAWSAFTAQPPNQSSDELLISISKSKEFMMHLRKIANS